MLHEHRCHCCKTAYSCVEKRCKAEQAAKTNKQGPYCLLCRTGIMFIRYAHNRGIDPLLFVKVMHAHERELVKTTK